METAQPNGLPLINSLWIGRSLGPMGQLTLLSFARQGYSFRLWVYDVPDDLPHSPRIFCCDAREIMPEQRIFRYDRASHLGHGKGSVAGFSDLFRYALLAKYGGWWTDMDMTCLGRLPETIGYCFRSHHKLPAVGNLMHCPPNSMLMAHCLEETKKLVHSGSRDWMLPIRILNNNIKKFLLVGEIREITNPDSWWTIRRFLLSAPVEFPANWVALHWNNTDWQRLQLLQDEGLPGSKYGALMQEHGIHLGPLSAAAKRRVALRLSLPWFAWCSVRNRLDL